MGSLFGGGGGSVQSPKAPKPIQLDVNQLEQNAVAADQAGYAQADQYMQQYYPALWDAQQSMIKQAYEGITGPTPPALENTFMNAANMQSMSALGGGDQSFGLGKGSLARNAAAANVASNEQGYRDYSRGVFEQLNAQFAPRTFGLTPEDAANVFTFNNNQYNNYLEQQYALRTNTYFQNQGLAAGQSAAGTGMLTSLAGSVISGLIIY